MQTLLMTPDLSSLAASFSEISVRLLAPTYLKGVVLLAIVGSTIYLLKNSSSALRYRVWFSGIAALLLLPVVTAVLPAWKFYVLPPSESAVSVLRIDDSVTADSPEQIIAPRSANAGETLYSIDDQGNVVALSDAVEARRESAVVDRATPTQGVLPGAVATIRNAYNSVRWGDLHWTAWIALVWAAGAFLNLLRIGIAHIGVAALVRRSRRVDEDDWQLLLEDTSRAMGITERVRLRWSDLSIVPMNAGVLKSIILLPESAESWPLEKRRAVLLHELAHVGRKDCLTHFVTQVTCALHWINPFVWHASSRMVCERECAADDAVLAAGTKPSSYARTLLETAQNYSSANWSAPASLAMARKSQLENRMLAILDPAKRPGELSRANRILASVVVMIIALPLAAFTPAQQQTQRQKVLRTADHLGPAPRVVIPDFDVDVPDFDVDIPEVVIPDFDVDIPDFTFEMPDFEMPEMDIDIPDFDVDLGDLDIPGFTIAGSGSSVRVTSGSFSRDGVVLVVGDSLTIEQIIRLRRYGVDSEFIKGLKALGYDTPAYDDLISLARHGAGPDYIRGMRDAGFNGLELGEYSRAARYGMDPEYAKSMREAGLGTLTLDELTKLSRYGADPELIRSLKAAGLTNLKADDVTRLSRYGVDGEKVTKLKALGYNNLTIDDLVGVARYGADTDYIESMRSAGYRNLSLSDVMSLSRYGISSDMVAALSAAGYKDLSVQELTSMGRYGVSADLIQELGKAGYKNLSADEIVSLARYGVDADYLSGLRDVGYSSLRVEEIRDMSRHGVDADFIREMQDAGVKHPSVDDLVKMKRHGVDAAFIKSLRDN